MGSNPTLSATQLRYEAGYSRPRAFYGRGPLDNGSISTVAAVRVRRFGQRAHALAVVLPAAAGRAALKPVADGAIRWRLTPIAATDAVSASEAATPALENLWT